MAQPPPYAPVTSFITYQAQQAWFPGQNLDVEFNAIDTSIAAIEHNLAEIQQDDGKLANGSVDFPQLSTALVTALTAGGVVVPVSTILTQPNTWTLPQTFSSAPVFNAGIDFAASQYLNWGSTLGSTGYGIRDNGGVLQFKNSGGVWKQFRTQISVLDYGADNTGVADSTAAINAAIAAAEAANSSLAAVYFPAGIYLISSTLQISASNVFLVGEMGPGVVLIERKTDFGAAIKFSLSSGGLANVGLINLEVADTAAINNTPGFSTTTNSPYQVIFDGCFQIYIQNVQIQGGSGCLALKAVISAYIDDITLINPGTSELDAMGTGLYVGSSINPNAPFGYSSQIYISTIEMEGGSPFAGKLFDGIRVDGCDGLWISNGHVQGTQNADFHIAHSGAHPMSNIYCTNFMLDECNGNGILMDGTVLVQNSIFEGMLSAGGTGGATKAGWSLSGTGGLKNFHFVGTVTGWGSSGIVLNASNTQNVVIRALVFGNNNSSNNPAPAISIQQGINIAVVGGVAGGGDQCKPNIAIGAAAARVSLSGVLASASSTYGVTIASGATYVTIVGCDLSSNTSGGINDASGSILKKFVGNIGAPDLFSDGNPTTFTSTGTTAVTLRADGGSGNGQILLEGASNNNQQLVIGYNTASDYGGMQALLQGVGFKPICLNYLGGNVFLGGTAAAAGVVAYTFGGGLQIGAPTGADKGAGTINMAAALYNAGNQVVAARQTGWTAMTGTPQRGTFTTGGVTLAQLAGVVMALEQDLITHGLIGT